jgi:hypothetical protein
VSPFLTSSFERALSLGSIGMKLMMDIFLAYSASYSSVIPFINSAKPLKLSATGDTSRPDSVFKSSVLN